MADDNTKGVVLKGPWKRAKTVKKSQTEMVWILKVINLFLKLVL